MADDAPTQDLSTEIQRDEDAPASGGDPQPEKLKVHSLARVLGTTSKRVLDALADFDGRARSAHSSVDNDEAERVREALASDSEEPTGAENLADEPAGPADDPAGDEPVDAEPVGDDEPESRLILETPSTSPAPAADYLPLFVAPQPIEYERVVVEDEDEDDDTDDDTDSDDEQSERPGRRRRRGRRGRGRGRGEQNGDDPDGDPTGSPGRRRRGGLRRRLR